MKLIDKDTLVAEIERMMNRYDSEYDEDSTEVKAAKGNVCHEILCTIDTLEVKEVDLDESARHYLLHEHVSPLNEVLHQADLKVEMQYHKDIEDAYKAGFELGLKVQKGENV